MPHHVLRWYHHEIALEEALRKEKEVYTGVVGARNVSAVSPWQ
jgi:hypothetical protein